MPENGHFEFGEFRLEQHAHELRRNGAEIHLAERPFQVLTFLIENRDRLVERRELLDRFWDGHDVYDDALRKCVGSIRNALGDTQRPARFIETRYGAGYRFIGAVRNGHEPAGTAATSDQTRLLADLAPRRVFIVAAAVIIIAFVGMGLYLAVSRSDTAPLGTAAATVRVNSIAVLPLKNLTGDAENDYLCEGMTENLVQELSRIEGLRTVSSGSISALKHKGDDLSEIGQAVGVDALLQGSISKRGDLLGLSVRLVAASDGTILWTAPDIERPLDSASELQTTLARIVAVALEARLNAAPETRKAAAGEAYQEYLKGRFFWNKRTRDGILRSIDHYKRAIELQPNFAPAHAGLAESYVQGIWHVPFDPVEALANGKRAAEKAIEIDATLPEAYAALANVTSLEWNWREADRLLQTAIRLDGRFARAHHSRAFVLLILGRNEEAIEAIEAARALDPLNLVINTDKAMILFASRRDDEAFAQWRLTLELDPNFVLAHEHLAMAHGVVGNVSEALDELARIRELRGQPPEQMDDLRTVYQRDLDQALAAEADGGKASSAYIAGLYLALGHREKALSRIERAFREHAADVVLVRTSRQFDALLDDPRLTELFRKAGMTDQPSSEAE